MASRSSSVMGAAAMMPLQPDAGALSLTIIVIDSAGLQGGRGLRQQHREQEDFQQCCVSSDSSMTKRLESNVPMKHMHCLYTHRHYQPVRRGSTNPPASLTHCLRADSGSTTQLVASSSAAGNSLSRLWMRLGCVVGLKITCGAVTVAAATAAATAAVAGGGDRCMVGGQGGGTADVSALLGNGLCSCRMLHNSCNCVLEVLGYFFSKFKKK